MNLGSLKSKNMEKIYFFNGENIFFQWRKYIFKDRSKVKVPSNKDKEISNTPLRTKYGHYEFVVVPFALIDAPAIFMCLLNVIFKN
jgi:hypothetical protein